MFFALIYFLSASAKGDIRNTLRERLLQLEPFGNILITAVVMLRCYYAAISFPMKQNQIWMVEKVGSLVSF